MPTEDVMPAGRQEKFLPKEPADLPKEPLEIPAQQQTQPNYSSNEIKTLLSWSAPGRPFQKKTKEYFLTSLLIVLFVEVILFLFSQYLLMVVVLSLIFVSFALSVIPPHNFHYRISTEGITIEDHFYLWQELYDFYFKKIGNSQVLKIRTHAYIPGELTITLGDMDKEHVKSVILPFLPYRELIKPTFVEKSGDWLSKNFPLEK